MAYKPLIIKAVQIQSAEVGPADRQGEKHQGRVTTDNLLLSDTYHDESTACQVKSILLHRNAERDFHAEKLGNDTHASTTDPNAWLFRKGRGKEAKLCHMA